MLLILFLLLPPVTGGLLWLFRKNYPLTLLVALSSSLTNLICAVLTFRSGFTVTLPVSVYGFDLTFRADATASLFLLLAAVLFPLLAVYTAGHCKAKPWGGLYFFYLFLSLGMLNGALLADHLGLLLFFWEGLLCTLFGILLLGNSANPKAAVKGLTLAGTSDLILMLGIAATTHAAETGTISAIERLPVAGFGAMGCVLLLLGALGKAGCMPFQSWIPAAAEDGPTAFMAAFPGSLSQVAGIYLASRAVTQIFDIIPHSAMSNVLMILGAMTLIGGAGMSLIQKKMKRALAYLAISQTGLMVLGLGTGLEEGVSGGVFQLFTSVLCMAGLFMVSGSVELQAGTTELQKLGGLSRRMPFAAFCMCVFSLSLSGFPLLGGFFSSTLILSSILKSNIVFYIAALIGAFITAASLMRQTRSVFFGKPNVQKKAVKEKPRKESSVLTVPMVLLSLMALLCTWNALPLNTIGKAFGFTCNYSGLPKSWLSALLLCAVLIFALLDHVLGERNTGSPLTAADHLRFIPGVRQLYALAEAGALDPYVWLTGLMAVLSRVFRKIEDGVSWIYDHGIPGATAAIGDGLSRFDNGSLSRYLLLAICGMLAVGFIFVWILL